MLSVYFVGEFLMRNLTLNTGPGKGEYHWYSLPQDNIHWRAAVLGLMVLDIPELQPQR